jgi:hypothetical protein
MGPGPVIAHDRILSTLCAIGPATTIVNEVAVR